MVLGGGIPWLGASPLGLLVLAWLFWLTCLEEMKVEQFLWGAHIPSRQLLFLFI